MLERLLFPGINGLIDKAKVMGKLSDRDHYIEYLIDTDKPLRNPVAEGDADLWVRMQNFYYAEIQITKRFKITGDEKNWHYEQYDMTIHCDTYLPYDRIAVTFQQALAEFLGPANHIEGVIRVYRNSSKSKFVAKDGWTLVKETPMMNVYQKI